MPKKLPTPRVRTVYVDDLWYVDNRLRDVHADLYDARVVRAFSVWSTTFLWITVTHPQRMLTTHYVNARANVQPQF